GGALVSRGPGAGPVVAPEPDARDGGPASIRGVSDGCPERTSSSTGNAASTAVDAAIAHCSTRRTRRGFGASRGAIRCHAPAGGDSSGSAAKASSQVRGGEGVLLILIAPGPAVARAGDGCRAPAATWRNSGCAASALRSPRGYGPRRGRA